MGKKLWQKLLQQKFSTKEFIILNFSFGNLRSTVERVMNAKNAQNHLDNCQT